MMRVKLISRGMRGLLNDDGVARDLAARAERVASAARATAPVKTGAYRASITVTADRTDRAVARVGAGVPYALAIEAGTGNLARSIGAAS